MNIAQCSLSSFIKQAPSALVISLLVGGVNGADTIAEEVSDQEQSAIAAITNIGGTVQRVSQNNPNWIIDFHLGGRELTDEGLVHVAALKNVVALDVRDTKISDAGLVHLKDLMKLRVLHLERTGVGDEGIAHLANLTNLEYLNVYGTKVTDQSLTKLTNLKNLRGLYVWQTEVTDEGIAALEKTLPDLEVVQGVDLSKLPVFVAPEPPKPTGDLKWIATTNAADAPKSNNGNNTQVFFENKSKQKVKLQWVSYDNELKLYSVIDPGATYQQNTYANNTWLITDEKDQPLGYFIVTDEVARAVIPN